jgi:hypothetical protein
MKDRKWKTEIEKRKMMSGWKSAGLSLHSLSLSLSPVLSTGRMNYSADRNSHPHVFAKLRRFRDIFHFGKMRNFFLVASVFALANIIGAAVFCLPQGLSGSVLGGPESRKWAA